LVSDEMKAGDRSAQVAMTADVSRRLRAVANKLLHDRGDAEDLVQHAWLTYVKTVRSGVVVREVEAFLVGVVHRAAMSVGRQSRRRAGRLKVGLGDDEQVEPAGSGCEALDYDALLAKVRLALPISLRASFDDCLAGKSDQEIAARDGVAESAVRKRRSRLVAVMDDGLLTEILAGGVSQKPLTGTYPVGAGDGQPPTPNPMQTRILATALSLLLAGPAAAQTNFSGEINSITYNAKGEASKFVVGGPPSKEFEVGSPNKELTNLLKRLMDKDTKVVVVDEDANGKFDNKDTIKEEG